jgi:predicted glycosyltransferase
VVQILQYMEAERSIHLYIFSGPLMSNEDFDRLKSFSNRRIQVSRFNPDFLSYLAAADLSVSMAGYNTCTNILAARVPSLVWPFSQNREQRLRAETLARLGALEILNEDDLQPPRLASIMEASLCRQSQSRINIDLDGAINTARWLESWIENSHQKQ